MPRILVFGNSGQVARSLQDAATNLADFTLIAHGRDQTDITQFDQVEAAITSVSPDIVINAAAYTAVDQAEQETDAADALNHLAVAHIARIAAGLEIPVVHLSTDYVFNGQKKSPYVEGDPISPLGVYGQSKAEGETALRRTCSRHVILRTAWVYSAYGRNFVKTMLRLMAERAALNVVEDQIGCPTSAHDIARRILQIVPDILGPGFDGFGTYHLVADDAMSWCDFARLIRQEGIKCFGPDWAGQACVINGIPASQYPTPAQRPVYSVLSTAKFKSVFGAGLDPVTSELAACLGRIREQGGNHA